MQASLEWISCAKQISPTTRNFTIKDKYGKSIILEWEKTDIQSPNLTEFKKTVCELAAQTLAPTEALFLQQYPEAVDQELFLKPCLSLFENGLENVDWNLVEETIQSTIKQFYLSDLSSFDPAIIKPLLEDVYFLVKIKEGSESQQLLGFAMFAITPALPFGNVKLINIAVLPEEKDRGLNQLLLSTVFNILPQTKSIFLYIRPTNNSSLKEFRSCGFALEIIPKEDPNHKVNMEYLILLEYRAEKSRILQETANSLVN